MLLEFQIDSSVAKGGGGGLEPPIGLKSTQIRTFLVLLRPIFAQKMKTAFPKGFGEEAVKDLQNEFPNLAEKSVSISVNTFLFFFLEDHLFLGGKAVSISDYSRKIRLNFGGNLFVFLFFFGDQLFLGGKPFQFPISAEKSVSISDFGPKIRLNFGKYSWRKMT